MRCLLCWERIWEQNVVNWMRTLHSGIPGEWRCVSREPVIQLSLNRVPPANQKRISSRQNG